MQKTSFGQLPNGTPVDLYTLTNARGLKARVTNYGTIITELHVPDRRGQLADVVLGFDNLQQYLAGHPYFGCTVGRVANRIAKGQFSLNGKTYSLAINNGPNHLHGGMVGFDKVLWKAEPKGDSSVEFSRRSPNGEENYPGNLDVSVKISLTAADELRIDYRATTDQATPVNLTNHTYFNLAGQGPVLDHELMINADAFTPSTAELVPTGEIKQVKGTLYDFTRPTNIGARFNQMTSKPVGYDTNYVLNSAGKLQVVAARVYEPKSGRVMEVETTHPGVQLYTANFLDGSLKGKNGVVYNQHTGFCLETQHFPDSVNQPSFPSTILQPGEVYSQTTIHRFSAK